MEKQKKEKWDVEDVPRHIAKLLVRKFNDEFPDHKNTEQSRRLVEIITIALENTDVYNSLFLYHTRV